MLAGRFHCAVKRTPTEVQRALAYVLLNARKHYRERRRRVPPLVLDGASLRRRSFARTKLRGQQARPGRPVNGSVHPTAAQQRVVRRVHNRIDPLAGDVASLDLETLSPKRHPSRIEFAEPLGRVSMRYQDTQKEPRKTHYRTIFLSDIHLGTKGCQADRLIHFLKHHDCDTLYLVGDIIDGWRLRSSFYWPQSHNNVLRRFFTLMKRGTRIVFVTGNHDEFLRKYSDMEVGNLCLVDQAVHETADGRRLLVVHGDQFDVITRYHRWLAFLGDIGYNLLLRLNRTLNGARARFGYGYWSLSAWIKRRVKRAVNYPGSLTDLLYRRALLIFGKVFANNDYIPAWIDVFVGRRGYSNMMWKPCSGSDGRDRGSRDERRPRRPADHYRFVMRSMVGVVTRDAMAVRGAGSRAPERATRHTHGPAGTTTTRSRRDADAHRHLQQPEPQRATLRAGQFGAPCAEPSQRMQQHIGERREVQAQLVGAHRVRAGAVGEQVELPLLDAVLHVPARAVQLLVQPPGRRLAPRHGGHHETWVRPPLARCSALPTTRRARVHDLRVRYSKSRKRRAGLPVRWCAARASSSCYPKARARRALRASPNR